MPKAREKTIAVEALAHNEAKRLIIPTAGFESLMRDEENSPVRIAYERRNAAIPIPPDLGHPGIPPTALIASSKPAVRARAPNQTSAACSYPTELSCQPATGIADSLA